MKVEQNPIYYINYGDDYLSGNLFQYKTEEQGAFARAFDLAQLTDVTSYLSRRTLEFLDSKFGRTDDLVTPQQAEAMYGLKIDKPQRRLYVEHEASLKGMIDYVDHQNSLYLTKTGSNPWVTNFLGAMAGYSLDPSMFMINLYAYKGLGLLLNGTRAGSVIAKRLYDSNKLIRYGSRLGTYGAVGAMTNVGTGKLIAKNLDVEYDTLQLATDIAFGSVFSLFPPNLGKTISDKIRKLKFENKDEFGTFGDDRKPPAGVMDGDSSPPTPDIMDTNKDAKIRDNLKNFEKQLKDILGEEIEIPKKLEPEVTPPSNKELDEYYKRVRDIKEKAEAPEVKDVTPKKVEAEAPAPKVEEATPKRIEAEAPAPKVEEATPKRIEAEVPAPKVEEVTPKRIEAEAPAPIQEDVVPTKDVVDTAKIKDEAIEEVIEENRNSIKDEVEKIKKDNPDVDFPKVTDAEIQKNVDIVESTLKEIIEKIGGLQKLNRISKSLTSYSDVKPGISFENFAKYVNDKLSKEEIAKLYSLIDIDKKVYKTGKITNLGGHPILFPDGAVSKKALGYYLRFHTKDNFLKARMGTYKHVKDANSLKEDKFVNAMFLNQSLGDGYGLFHSLYNAKNLSNNHRTVIAVWSGLEEDILRKFNPYIFNFLKDYNIASAHKIDLLNNKSLRKDIIDFLKTIFRSEQMITNKEAETSLNEILSKNLSSKGPVVHATQPKDPIADVIKNEVTYTKPIKSTHDEIIKSEKEAIKTKEQKRVDRIKTKIDDWFVKNTENIFKKLEKAPIKNKKNAEKENAFTSKIKKEISVLHNKMQEKEISFENSIKSLEEIMSKYGKRKTPPPMKSMQEIRKEFFRFENIGKEKLNTLRKVRDEYKKMYTELNNFYSKDFIRKKVFFPYGKLLQNIKASIVHTENMLSSLNKKFDKDYHQPAYVFYKKYRETFNKVESLKIDKDLDSYSNEVTAVIKGIKKFLKDNKKSIEKDNTINKFFESISYKDEFGTQNVNPFLYLRKLESIKYKGQITNVDNLYQIDNPKEYVKFLKEAIDLLDKDLKKRKLIGKQLKKLNKEKIYSLDIPEKILNKMPKKWMSFLEERTPNPMQIKWWKSLIPKPRIVIRDEDLLRRIYKWKKDKLAIKKSNINLLKQIQDFELKTIELLNKNSYSTTLEKLKDSFSVQNILLEDVLESFKKALKAPPAEKLNVSVKSELSYKTDRLLENIKQFKSKREYVVATGKYLDGVIKNHLSRNPELIDWYDGLRENKFIRYAVYMSSLEFVKKFLSLQLSIEPPPPPPQPLPEALIDEEHIEKYKITKEYIDEIKDRLDTMTESLLDEINSALLENKKDFDEERENREYVEELLEADDKRLHAKMKADEHLQAISEGLAKDRKKFEEEEALKFFRYFEKLQKQGKKLGIKIDPILDMVSKGINKNHENIKPLFKKLRDTINDMGEYMDNKYFTDLKPETQKELINKIIPEFNKTIDKLDKEINKFFYLHQKQNAKFLRKVQELIVNVGTYKDKKDIIYYLGSVEDDLIDKQLLTQALVVEGIEYLMNLEEKLKDGIQPEEMINFFQRSYPYPEIREKIGFYLKDKNLYELTHKLVISIIQELQISNYEDAKNIEWMRELLGKYNVFIFGDELYTEEI